MLVFKMLDLNKEKINVMSTLQARKVGKEWNIGLFNYEINTQGEKNFEVTTLLLNKSNDLIFHPKIKSIT